MRTCIVIFICFFLDIGSFGQSPYPVIQQKLANGWNTWNTNSALCHVLMPYGLSLQLNLIQRHYNAQKYLNDAQINNKDNEPLVKPVLHAFDGSYTELELKWQQAHVRIETASDGADWFMLVTRISPNKDSVILQLEGGMLWNKPGYVTFEKDKLAARLPDNRSLEVFSLTPVLQEYFTKSNNPFLTAYLRSENGFTTRRNTGFSELKKVIQQKREAFLQDAARFREKKELYLGMASCLAWNTIYDIKKERVITTVDREWNVNRGGYVFFGWDNFFLSYMCAFGSKDLAFANAIEALSEATEEGFISNNSQGNGRKAWDRSQPPVGSMMCMGIYHRFPEKWFLEAVYPALLKWNRWWLKRRMNGDLLSWGSHKAYNPFNDRRHHDSLAAWLESGIDDSPMFEGIAFDAERNILEMQDVGLNALYIGDLRALAEMAGILGRKEDQQILLADARNFSGRIQRLWDARTGIYRNYRTDTRSFSEKLSPTMFYPLIAHTCPPNRARTMIEKHFYNKEEFWGEYLLPSIARNDPQFPQQKYWKGAVWPPMNFLVYWGLKEYKELENARKDLARISSAMFEKQWLENRFVSENYSAITGTGDDPRLNSSGWYAWGGLMAAIGLMEEERKEIK